MNNPAHAVVDDAPPSGSRTDGVVIGRDLLPIGRVIRVFVGLLIIVALVASAHRNDVGVGAVADRAVPAFVGTAIAYTVLLAVLGERLLSRIDGWLAAIILVAPMVVLTTVVPGTIAGGIWLYVAAGLIVQAIIGYGGCEVAGLPTALLRRRYRIYCALSGADVVERWLYRRAAWLRWTLTLLALLGIGGLFALVGAITPTWVQNYEYLLYLAAGLLISRIGRRNRA